MEGFSKDHSTWDSHGENWSTLSRRFLEKSTVDILEVVNDRMTTFRRVDAGLEGWLDDSSSWPRAQFRILFIDENEHDTDRICVSTVALQKIFRALNISQRYLDTFATRSCGSRIVKYDDNNQLSWHEFWYSTVHWSPPKPKVAHPAKKILGWSFMNVWMGRHAHNGNITMLITRCPVAVKQEFLEKADEYFKRRLRYPMMIHLYFLRSIARNHWNTLRSRMQNLHEEEQRVDVHGEEAQNFAERSRNLLFICRQFSAFLVDSDLAQPLIERVKRENEWFVKQVPPQATDSESKTWQHDSESLAESLGELLDGFKTNSRYAQSCEQRAKIGVDESFSRISQLDSSTNLSIAKRGEENARSLWILQLLALFFLPLSLATSVFGMGFFSTQPDTNGNPALYVAPEWWYFLALAMPAVSVMYLIVFAWSWSKKMKDQEQSSEKGHRRLDPASP